MANDRRDEKPELTEKMLQDPISEADADELRAAGRGFEREEHEPPQVRHAHGSGGSSESPRHAGEADSAPPERRPRRGKAETGDASSIAQRRAEGRFESEGGRTQVEEDFGERGLRMPEHFDSGTQRSINDPDEE